MKILELKEYIFKRYTAEQIKLAAGLTISFVVSLVIYISQSSTPAPDSQVPEALKINLNVLIPKNHVLYPFEANNFENVEPLLEAYNMVQVYDPKSGELIAKNIKVLRAPKNPSHLAFLIPVKIANKFAPYGLEFKIAIQKYINKRPTWVLKKTKRKKSHKQPLITFGVSK